MQIGYIGLGALGAELALCFAKDHALCVWDLNPAACQRLAAAGAQVAASPAVLARQCDVVLLCLPRSADVRQLVLGAGGLAEGLAPGKLVIDQTSGTPGETSLIAGELAARGVAMIDAAVSANPQLVHKGMATLMVAGPDAVVERALPVLRVMTQTIHRCGARVGDGQAVKLVNNAIYAATRLATLELTALARKCGFTLQAISDAWGNGLARSQATDKMLPALLRGEASTNFALSLMLKDLNQAVEFGMAHGASMPIASMTRALLQAGLHLQGPQARLEDMLGVVESLAGVRITSGDAGATATGSSTLQDLERSVAAINLMAMLECVTAGVRYGLNLAVVREVLGCSSGSSAAGAAGLAALAGEEGPSGKTLLDWVRGQRGTAGLAVQRGAPVFLLTQLAGILESALAMLGPDAGLSDLAQWIARTGNAQTSTTQGA
jgi:3-hydroxyisobutyrate dehydrogenase